MKKVLAVLLATVLLLTAMPLGAVFASSGPLSVDQLREKYPHGAYWNHRGTVNKPGDYTWEPCLHHNSCGFSGSCGCNSYNGVAIQCMGFAYQLASLAYDCDPRGEWTANYSTAALNSLKAGDIVRYRNNTHSIFVIGVSGDTVTYADCNSDRHCQIKWDQTISKATLKSTFTYVKPAPYKLEFQPATPVLTIRFDANGGEIPGSVIGRRYTVTDPDGVNMRSGPGTGNPVLTALAKGTAFTVKTGETKESGGYTWGKTTVGNTTGWVVISDFVTQTGALREGSFYLEGSLVHKASDDTPLTQKMTLGKTVSGGLRNVTTLGIQREGYRFVGWSTQKTEFVNVYDQDDASLTPETIYPELEKGSATVTLYAVWECDHRYSLDCDTTCNVCGAIRLVFHQYVDDCDADCEVCGAEREAFHLWKQGTCTACGVTAPPPVIVSQPKTGYAPMGEKVSATVEATGDELTYVWYIKNEGQTKYYLSSVTGPSYVTKMSENSKNRRLICYVYDGYGNRVQAKTVLLRESVGLVTQPKSVSVEENQIARVTVEATGDDLTYVWYIKNAGRTKYSKSSVTTATYKTRMTEKSNGRRLICYVYDRYGNRVQTQTVMMKQK